MYDKKYGVVVLSCPFRSKKKKTELITLSGLDVKSSSDRRQPDGVKCKIHFTRKNEEIK